MMALPRGPRRRQTADDEDYYDNGWPEPNLTEPKLQDVVGRRHPPPETSRRRQRPRAARRELKSAPTNDGKDAAASPHQEMAQIRYFKYIPYRGMSEPERRKYLSLGPARLTSSRTEPTPRQRPQTKGSTTTTKTQHHRPGDEASFWASASKSKSLKVYDYHLAELSLAYRSPPSLLSLPRRLTTPPEFGASPRRQEQNHQDPSTSAAIHRSLFYSLHTGRALPASAPTLTQQQLTMAEKTTQVSRGCTPFIESALSDNFPTEPGDVVNKSESNRLLNVVSVDECHVRHRRRRRRLRRVNLRDTAAAGEVGSEEEGEGEGEDEEDWEEKEEAGDGEEEEEETVENQSVADRVPAASQSELVAEQQLQPPQPELQTSSADVYMPSSNSTRPTTEHGRKKRRTEKEMRQLAAARFHRRNEILREKMAIYLDWKLNQERMGLIEVREGDAAARFERFTVELVRQEAMVANQFRDVGRSGSSDAVMDTLAYEYSSPRVMSLSHHGSGAAAAAAAQRPELSLTEMFDALNV